MIKVLARLASPLLNLALVRRVRRNHGLEHATIHMLSRRLRQLSMAGRADQSGFYLYGEVDTDMVHEAVVEALTRMKNGEAKWAVHPNCGTGLVTTSFMTSLAAVLGLTGARQTRQDIFNRLPLVMLLTIFALILSQPLGLSIQKYFTTSGEPGDLEIADISRYESRLPWGAPLTVHRVQTRRG